MRAGREMFGGGSSGRDAAHANKGRVSHATLHDLARLRRAQELIVSKLVGCSEFMAFAGKCNIRGLLSLETAVAKHD